MAIAIEAWRRNGINAVNIRIWKVNKLTIVQCSILKAKSIADRIVLFSSYRKWINRVLTGGLVLSESGLGSCPIEPHLFVKRLHSVGLGISAAPGTDVKGPCEAEFGVDEYFTTAVQHISNYLKTRNDIEIADIRCPVENIWIIDEYCAEIRIIVVLIER